MDEVALVSGDISEIFQTRSLSVVAADECSENSRVTEMLVKVVKLARVHWIHLVVVETHPLEEDRLRHRVDITLAHRIINI